MQIPNANHVVIHKFAFMQDSQHTHIHTFSTLKASRSTADLSGVKFTTQFELQNKQKKKKLN